MNKRCVYVSLLLSSLTWVSSESMAQTLVSAGKPVTASAFTGVQFPSLVTDGLYGLDQHWSAGAYAPQWITVDLEAPFSISSITVIGPLTTGFPGYTVQFNVNGSLNNSDWTFLGSATLTDSTDMGLRSKDFSVPGDSYRYIRLDYTGGSHHSSAAEIQVYAIPEPSVAALLVAGAALVGVLFRRKLAKQGALATQPLSSSLQPPL